MEIKPLFALYLLRFVKFAPCGNAKIPSISCLAVAFAVSPADMCHLNKDGDLRMHTFQTSPLAVPSK